MSLGCGSNLAVRGNASASTPEWAPARVADLVLESRRRVLAAPDTNDNEADDQLSADLLHEESLSTGHTFAKSRPFSLRSREAPR